MINITRVFEGNQINVYQSPTKRSVVRPCQAKRLISKSLDLSLIHIYINNLVQVVNNLISNAIDAQLPGGDHTISIGIARNAEAQALDLTVRDRGVGVPPEIAGKLFRQMVTSKGTRGTGLGIYISNAVIRGKFDGTMWYQANPPGGSIFGMSFPIGNITIKERKQLRN